MTTLKNTVAELFHQAISATFHQEIDPVIQNATRTEFGDYQANFALRLAKELQQKPADIAKKVVETLHPHADIFQSLDVSGPGFINIKITNDYLAKHLQQMLQHPRLGVNPQSPIETVVVDYSSPNVAKEMHVGHLRSLIIGDAIVRLLEFVGHRVIRQNHIGDWGTQFGMIIEYMLQTNFALDGTHAYSKLDALYKKSKQLFDADSDFADRARKRVVALQQGEHNTRDVWQKLVEESKHYFQTAYQKLSVLLTEQDAAGESFYNDMLPVLTEELANKKLATIDQGALVIALDGFVDPDGKPLPFLIRKSDGAYLYAATDLAAIKYRVETLGADRIIYVVDARQKQHFAMLFAAAKKAAIAHDDTQLEHAAFGSVLGEDHKPFKTRSGESIKLIDLLQEAEKRAADIIVRKHPDLKTDELALIANHVGIGALKYADLRNDKIKDSIFSWDKMLAFDGNTGPYLQNAYVRICAIFRKSLVELTKIPVQSLQITDPIEHTLGIKIAEFPNVILSVAHSLQLHNLCEYLYDLAGIFHKFYEHCPVLSAEETIIRDSRLLLCLLTARTLKQGLNLLGIHVLEKM